MAGKFLPEFELYVMLAVARLEDEAYGATILREIEERTGRPVSIGALYATLARLDAKGLIELDVVEPQPGQRGRARKYCNLTPEGQAALSHSTEMLRRMMDGVAIAQTAGRDS
jgi:DNA-binding PadR family transcriptional regulator